MAMDQRISAALLQKLRHKLKDDSGIAGLVLVSVIVIVAFTALSIFLNKYIGDTTFARLKSTAAGQSTLTSALTAHFFQSENYKIACPDTDFDGVENTPCDTAATVYKGVVPWVTLGLSKNDVLDPQGNFYTYLVSGTANGYNAANPSSPNKGLCASLTSDFDGKVEFTGEVLGSELELLDTTQTPGQNPSAGRNVPFVLISHGANRLGAFSVSGTTLSTPTGQFEIYNAQSSPASHAIYSGPYNGKAGTEYFDDQVFAPSATDAVKICGLLTPGGVQNGDISDGLDNPATLAANFNNPSANGVTIINKNGNYVARFTGAAANVPRAIVSTAAFNPSVRPNYISLKWTPNPTYATTPAAISGLSIATRATDADRSTFDLYNAGTFAGISFRFFDGAISGTGEDNHISIFQYNAAAPQIVIGTSATTFSLRANATYIVEVYDDGTNVWSRITEDGDTTNTTMVSGSTNADHIGDQGITIHTISDVLVIADIDDILVGRPMLALETNGGAMAMYAGSAGTNGSSTGNLSVEAWIRPRGLPSAGNKAVIVGQWDTAAVSSSSYRMYLDSNGLLNLDVATTAGPQTFSMGIVPELDAWTHVAATFNRVTGTAAFYQNGASARTARSTAGAAVGVNAAAVTFGIGADFAGSTSAPVDGYNGDVSDVRVWTDVRTASEISSYFRRRLAGVEANAADTAELAGLAVNWKLDAESGGLTSTTAVATPSPGYGSDGTGSVGVRYVPALSVFVRPNAREFCPAGTVARLYQCDFRSTATATITVPSRLPYAYLKAWGGGGGGALALYSGSGGGFAGGTVYNNVAGDWTLTLGLGGTAGAGLLGTGGDGTSSTLVRNGVTLAQGTGGSGGQLNLLGSLIGVVNALLGNSVVAAGDVPDAANDDDPFYSPSYLGVTLQNPARGGAPNVDGKNGALVLLW